MIERKESLPRQQRVRGRRGEHGSRRAGDAHGRLRQHSCESVTAAEVSRATRAAHSLPLLGAASYGVELVLLLLLPISQPI